MSRTTCAACVAVVLVSGPAHASQDGDAVVEILESAAEGSVPASAPLLDRLRTIGDAETRRLLRELERRPNEYDALRAAVAGVPAAARELLSTGRTVEEHGKIGRIALSILARLGTARDLDLAFELARPHAESERVDTRSTVDALTEVVSGILRRDDRGYLKLQKVFESVPPSSRLSLLKGVGAVGTYESLRLLAVLLGRVRSLDASILGQIGSIARRVKTPLDDGALQRIRLYLSSSEPLERQQCALALGRLDDYDSVSELIELLSDEHGGVRSNAYWSLKAITAMTINAEPRRWRLWFDDETAWWRNDAPGLIQTVRTGKLADVVAAINVMGSKRLFRRQLTPVLLPMLEHEDPMVVRMACSSLLGLRSPSAREALIPLLEHPDATVQAHAWHTLRALTGEDLPPEIRAWRPGEIR